MNAWRSEEDLTNLTVRVQDASLIWNGGHVLAKFLDSDFADRIAACVNFCAGFPMARIAGPGNPSLKKSDAGLAQTIDAQHRLIEQRDTLAAVLSDASKALSGDTSMSSLGQRIRAALANVDGRYATRSGHDYGCVDHPPGAKHGCSCAANAGLPRIAA